MSRVCGGPLTVSLPLQEQAERLRDLGGLLLQHHAAVRDLKPHAIRNSESELVREGLAITRYNNLVSYLPAPATLDVYTYRASRLADAD
jgi:hypothetical protein